MWCRVLLSSAIFLRGSDSGQQATLVLFSVPVIPGSLVACRSTASSSARLILSSAAASRADPDESPSNRPSGSPPACFAVSLLSSLTSSSVPAPRTTFTETPVFEVCSAKMGPRHFVLHQHFSREAKHNLRGPLHSDLNIERSLPSWRPRNGSHSKYAVRVPSL